MARKSRKQINIPIEEKNVYKVGIYSRLSDEDRKALEDNSIGHQRKICLDYMEGHDDMLLIATYIDNGFTGTNFSRKGFVQMMKDIEEGKINCVIVKDLSRLGREYIGAGELIERIFPKKQVRFIAVNNFYDSEEGYQTQGMSVPITNIANDFYSKDTSKKIRDSIQAKIQSGEFMPSSGSIPYGYIRGKDKFIADSETRDTVVRIYILRRERTAYNAIARILNEEQVPSPGKLRYMRGLTKDPRCEHSLWDRKAIREILHNETYLGHRIHGKVKREKLGQPKKRLDSSQWQYIYNAHEAIIEQKLFDEVQGVNDSELQRWENFGNGGELKENYRAALLGKLICGDCGSKMAGVRRNQRSNSKLPAVMNYQCGRYIQYRSKKECFNHYIPEAEIIKAIEQILNIRLSMVSDIEKMLQAVKVPNDPKQNFYSYKRKKLECEAKKERLWQDYSDGILNKDEYLYAKKKYDLLYQEICVQEEATVDKKIAMEVLVSEAEQWVSFMKKYRKVKKLDKQMIDVFVKEIRIYGGKRIEIVMNYRDELLSASYRAMIEREELYAG